MLYRPWARKADGRSMCFSPQIKNLFTEELTFHHNNGFSFLMEFTGPLQKGEVKLKHQLNNLPNTWHSRISSDLKKLRKTKNLKSISSQSTANWNLLLTPPGAAWIKNQNLSCRPSGFGCYV